MFFVLQKENNYTNLDIDLMILKEELNKQKFQHQYTFANLEEIEFPLNKLNMKEIIPVGSLEFVGKYLKTFHGINNMNPIEIPETLRKDIFLNRKYSIVNALDIPKEGYYFLKNASSLKDFSYTGNLEYFFYDEIFEEPKKKFDSRIHLNKEHMFVVSEVKNILSEYRVFVCEDEIKGIQFYDGDPTIMPSPEEINKLKQMINMYMLDKTRPKAYSLDIAIISTMDKTGRDLMILECHTFACLGLYGVNGSFLPYAYRKGLDWYLNYNTSVTSFSNF